MDFYYPVSVTRTSAAYNTTRRYHMTASADGAAAVSTPTPRELYVEKLISQEAGDGRGETRDRSDTLSSDFYYQPAREVELYGRFALKFGDTASQGLARVSTFTYMTQGRAACAPATQTKKASRSSRAGSAGRGMRASAFVGCLSSVVIIPLGRRFVAVVGKTL